MTLASLRLAVCAAVTLASCSSSDAVPDNAASAANATARGGAAPTNAQAGNSSIPVPPPGALTSDFMVGKWSAINEDCSSTLDFRRDGTVGTPIGDAKWRVEGDKLSFDYGDGSKPTVSTVKMLGDSRIEITHDSGTKETEKRC